jgi:hypothetical protein
MPKTGLLQALTSPGFDTVENLSSICCKFGSLSSSYGLGVYLKNRGKSRLLDPRL